MAYGEFILFLHFFDYRLRLPCVFFAPNGAQIQPATPPLRLARTPSPFAAPSVQPNIAQAGPPFQPPRMFSADTHR